MLDKIFDDFKIPAVLRQLMRELIAAYDKERLQSVVEKLPRYAFYNVEGGYEYESLDGEWLRRSDVIEAMNK